MVVQMRSAAVCGQTDGEEPAPPTWWLPLRRIARCARVKSVRRIAAGLGCRRLMGVGVGGEV